MFKSKLRQVIDGDTVDLYVNLGLGFFCNARIRLEGVDAPEIKKIKKEKKEFIEGQIAKLHVKKWFYPECEYYLLKAEHRDLYGRWLGEIFKVDKSESLNQNLIKICYKTEYMPWYHQEPLTERW